MARPRGLGALNVSLWIAGFFAVGAFGRFVVGGDGRLWFFIALAAMAVVVKWWPWTRSRVDRRRRARDAVFARDGESQ